MKIPVLYEDAHCFVVNKPAGVSVHPAGSIKDGSTLIEIIAKRRNAKVFLVHRLDKDTTGCLLVAKSRETCEKLQSQFKNHEVKKQYLAICFGVFTLPEAVIRAPVGRSLVNRTKMSLFRTSKSRDAVTRYEVLSRANGASLVKCDIETGRTHQIRVHLSSIGHPILGDGKYATDSSRALSEKIGAEKLCLHAWKMAFVPPWGDGEVRVSANLQESFQTIVDKCGL